jgi:hypothetical protein
VDGFHHGGVVGDGQGGAGELLDQPVATPAIVNPMKRLVG